MSTDQNNEKNGTLDFIGERIRLLRQKKGLTQSELAGDDITRNMLSRIEHGVALPSLPTLCAIAQRLDVPPGALLSDIDSYLAKSFENKLCALYKSKKYSTMISAAENEAESKLTENAATLLCKAYIEFAKELYQRGKLTEADTALSKASDLLSICRESDKEDTDKRIYLMKTLIAVCPARYTDDNAVLEEGSTDRLRAVIYDKNETAVYLYAISKLEGIAHSAYSMPISEAPELCAELLPMCEALTNELYKKHIEAKLDLINADYLGAKAKLVTTLTPEPPVPILYDICRDLEFCCKCCGDFENAYKYSTMRLELSKHISQNI